MNTTATVTIEVHYMTSDLGAITVGVPAIGEVDARDWAYAAAAATAEEVPGQAAAEIAAALWRANVEGGLTWRPMTAGDIVTVTIEDDPAGTWSHYLTADGTFLVCGYPT